MLLQTIINPQYFGNGPDHLWRVMEASETLTGVGKVKIDCQYSTY